jgi:hypothetical protein
MKNLFLVLLIFAFALPFMAQEAETEEPEPYTHADNECYAGGTMEGRCNQDTNGDGTVSQAEIDWAWNCGWYIARYNDGLFTRADVPSWCAVLLPALLVSEGSNEEQSPISNCFITNSMEWCATASGLTVEHDLDGVVDSTYYVVPDQGPGPDCPSGTVFTGTVGDWGGMFTAILLAQGFHASDETCFPI